MQYLGGKARLAKPISNIINNSVNKFYNDGESKTFVSLFCGACSVESLITGFDSIVCNDAHPYLIALLRAVADGYVPPDNLSEDEYKYIRNHKDDNPPLTGFAGFGCSFGGRWFEGYARSKRAGRNYCDTAKRGLLKKMSTLTAAEFTCLDYKDVPLPNKCIIYADPPYANTTKYSIKFDSDEFWNYIRQISKTHLVFISELKAPKDFIPIWCKQVTRSLDKNKENIIKANEQLFIHNSWFKKLYE